MSVLMGSGGDRPPSGYVTQGRYFDGVNDYATKAANLCADGKVLSGSLWLRQSAFATAGVILSTHLVANLSPGFSFRFTPFSGAFNLLARDSSIRLNAAISGVSGRTDWHNYLFSFDMADAAKRSLLLDGGGAATWTIYTNTNLDFATGLTNIGAFGDLTTRSQVNIAELWLTNSYIDFTDQANVKKFFKDGKPVNLGANGSTPTGAQPLIYMPYGDPADNKGSLGNFTVTGSLDVSSTSPSD
ncbi:MAG: hypothetical protein Q7U44_10320 [Desulfuromonadales bacterium]|nr:hypothetical protein [Desulfuromonadales bacterium]